MPARSFLVIQSGPRAGERIPISGDRFTIGRRAGNSLVIADQSVSGNHCELRRGTGADSELWVLKDTGSTNGTFYNGAKVLEAKVQPGTQFSLGSVLLRLESGGDDEITLDVEDSEPAAASPPAAHAAPVRPASTPARASAPPAPSAASDLDFVEDEPVLSQTTIVSPARASAASVLGQKPASPSASDGALVVDAGTQERARSAAAADARRGRLATIGILGAAVVALGIGGYVAFVGIGEAAPRPKPVAQVAGNLLPLSAASFEVEAAGAANATIGWQTRDTSLEPVEEDQAAAKPAIANVGFGYTTKKSRTGERAIEAKFDSPSVARATSDKIPVQAGQNLRFAAHVSKGTGAAALVQLVFRSRTNAQLRVVRAGGFLGFDDDSAKRNFARIEGTAVVPPDCDFASVSLVAFGHEGAVTFDDVELLASPEAAPAAILRKDLEFEADAADGRVCKIKRELLRRIGVAAPWLGAGKQNMLAARADANHWSFFAPDGQVTNVALTVEPGDAAVTYKYQVSGAAKPILTWCVDRAFASEFLVRGDKAAGRFRGEIQQNGATGLVFGEERERLRLIFTPPIALRGTPENNTMRFEAEAPAELTIQIQYSFEAEKRRAYDLEQQAETAEGAGKFGESIALRSQILEEFPFEAALVERNQTKRDARLQEGQKLVQKLERGVADADLFRIPEAFRIAKKGAETLISQYDGTDVAERAKGVIDVVNRAMAEAEAERGERDAQQLVTIAKAFTATQSDDLAGYIREYVKKHFPNTKSAQTKEGN